MSEYRYAMVNRPLSIGTAPKGWLREEPRPAPEAPHHDLARHGVLVYPRPLTAEESASYELAPMLEGETLGACLERRGRLGLDDTVAYVRQIAAALDAVHARGMVHRDLKPENIIFDENMELKMADFGLALDLKEERANTR